MARSTLFGRRIHFAGSVVEDLAVASAENVDMARQFVEGLTKELMRRGAVFVLPVDAEKTRSADGRPICFDWLIWSTLHGNLSLRPVGAPDPLVIAVQHHKNEGQVPAQFHSVWDDLRGSDRVRIENVSHWNMNSKRMEAQARVGDRPPDLMKHTREVLISVDVEAAGPIPGEYSMTSIGACNVNEPTRTFERRIKPINYNADPKALEIAGMSLEDLERDGVAPAEAMREFDDWLRQEVGHDGTLVFVGFNAPFDWSFVNYYFHRFLGQNPFGFTALDIKAYYMGVTGCSWGDTRSSRIALAVKPSLSANHNALRDAQYQAELFRLIREKSVLAKGQRT